MQVLVTGATGWVGSAVVRELLNGGHQVTGLVRSSNGAAALAAIGAGSVIGTLDDLALLQHSAARADAVVHTAFNHDFTRFAENCAQDQRAIAALGAGLADSDKMLLVTSGVAMLAQGRPATEADIPADLPNYPRRSESAARALAQQGIRAATVRLAPSVHGIGDQGFMRILINLARQTGVSAYLGDGQNCWPAVHREDAALLYRLALESGVQQAAYHAIDEAGIPFRQIAAAIAQGLGLPVAERGPEHFGWFAGFAGMHMPTSSVQTAALLGWTAAAPGLLDDLAMPAYFQS